MTPIEPDAPGYSPPAVASRRSVIKGLTGLGLAHQLAAPTTAQAASIQELGRGSAGSVLVAASDSPPSVRDVADFVCDGEADEVEIQAALDGLPAYGGHVVLAPGAFRLAGTVNVSVEGTTLSGPGSLLSWSGVTGATPILSVNRSNCIVASLRCRGGQDADNGVGIRLYGHDEIDAVNAVTIANCRCESLAVGIEIGIVGRGSAGDCVISGARINNVGVGILSRGFTNRIYNPFISNVGVGIQQTADRASGSFQLYGATINNWREQALLLERGRDFVIDSLWAEHTRELVGADLAAEQRTVEVIRIGTAEHEVVNAHFTGVQSFHLVESLPSSVSQYVFHLVSCRGLTVDAIRMDDQVPNAVVCQAGSQSGPDNRIRKVTYGPGPVPDGWDSSHLIESDPAATGEAIIENPPDVATSPAGSTVGHVATGEADYTVLISSLGTYFAKQPNGNVPVVSTSLRAVVDAIQGSDRHIHFTTGRFDFGPDHGVFSEIDNLTISGEGAGLTIIANASDDEADTEPFSFTRCDRCVVRDLSVSAGGSERTTSDAIDFDDGSDCLVEGVWVTGSRGRGIVFDGKDAGAEASRNTIRDCVVTGCPGSGIELLVANGTHVLGCRSVGNGESGLKVNRHLDTGTTSRHNRIAGGEFSQNGVDGILILEAEATTVDGVRCFNNGRDGIRVEVLEDGLSSAVATSILNSSSGNDPEAPATQAQQYGVNLVDDLASGRLNSTTVIANRLMGNALGGLADSGTGTIELGNLDLA